VDQSTAPFITGFTLAIIKALQGRKIYTPQKEVIHADLVPKVTEHVVEASMTEKTIPPRRFEGPKRLILVPKKQEQQKNETPLSNKVIPDIQPKVNSKSVWNKIKPLMDDVAVTSIECNGPGKNLMIIRAAGRQPTRIVLDSEEIKLVLETVSERTHIPLLEGVFRAQDDGYSIHAVVSDIIGSKFVIKKDTPYNLLNNSKEPSF
jgi:hypothetical protein